MDKQKLIESITDLPSDFSRQRPMIDKLTALELIKLLDEPEKVTIPQLVAEHIEWTKKEDFHLLGAMSRENFDKTLEDWFYTDDNMELFARAWLDGYKADEKRYTVVMKETKQPLFYNNLHERLFFSLGELATRFTRKQLEDAGLGEVFNSPLFKVVEVEE